MNCSVCKSINTQLYFNGNIRNGKYPNILKNQKIYKCDNCHSLFLNKVLDYSSAKYRKITNSSNNVNELSFLSNELENQLKFINISILKNKDVLDVGCGTGFLLDYMKPHVKSTSGLEKNPNFLKHLKKSGHNTYSDINEIKVKFDTITCFNVIEHVDNVITFIESMYNLLNKNGTLLLETPNSNDFLLDLIGNEFKSFYFRIQHRNYFDEKSLKKIMNILSINNYSILYSQKYGLNNLFNWVKHKKPGAYKKYIFDNKLDLDFKKSIEKNKASDHILIKINKHV